MRLLAETWWTHGHVGTGWAIAMMIGMVVFWPLEILDRRLAEGAISLDESRQRRAELVGNQTPRAKGAASTA